MTVRNRLSLSLAALTLVWATAGVAEPPSLDDLRVHARDLVNEDRDRRGLAPLRPDEALQTAAQRHAEDMLSRDYFAHEAPGGGTVADRFVAAGGDRWRRVAENIGRCIGCGSAPDAADIRQFQEDWMNSAEHRANILDPGLARFGFGIAVEDGRQYAVQTFAGPGSPREGEEDARPLPVEERADAALALINRARGTEAGPPLEPSAPLTDAAQALLRPLAEAAGPTDLQIDSGALYGALPEAQRQRWRELTVIAGACGGCGTRPSEADLKFFTREWMDNPRYRAVLLDSGFTDFGFAIAADGQGRKTALAVLGRRG